MGSAVGNETSASSLSWKSNEVGMLAEDEAAGTLAEDKVVGTIAEDEAAGNSQ